jgi:preprotein translocase subunit YajC
VACLTYTRSVARPVRVGEGLTSTSTGAVHRRKDLGVKATDLLIFALPVLLLLFMFSSQRKRQRTFTDLQSALQPGQEVVTTSGLFATIVSIDDAVAVLEISPGQTVRWDRRAIASVVPVDAANDTLGTPLADGDPDAPTTEK